MWCKADGLGFVGVNVSLSRPSCTTTWADGNNGRRPTRSMPRNLQSVSDMSFWSAVEQSTTAEVCSCSGGHSAGRSSITSMLAVSLRAAASCITLVRGCGSRCVQLAPVSVHAMLEDSTLGIHLAPAVLLQVISIHKGPSCKVGHVSSLGPLERREGEGSGAGTMRSTCADVLSMFSAGSEACPW